MSDKVQRPIYACTTRARIDRISLGVNNGMLIENHNQTDLISIREMLFRMHEWHVLRYPSNYQPIDEAAFQRWWAWINGSGSVLVARHDGKCVGYIAFRRDKRPATDFAKARDAYYIDQITVSDSFRKRGVGKLLLRAVEELAVKQGVHLVCLDCRYDNDANVLFEKCGYRPVRVHREKHLAD